VVPVALRPGGTSSAAAAATLGNGGFGEGVLVERARERDETRRGGERRRGVRPTKTNRHKGRPGSTVQRPQVAHTRCRLGCNCSLFYPFHKKTNLPCLFH
jgi:hypothetical protein